MGVKLVTVTDTEEVYTCDTCGSEDGGFNDCGVCGNVSCEECRQFVTVMKYWGIHLCPDCHATAKRTGLIKKAKTIGARLTKEFDEMVGEFKKLKEPS